ncbi:MAG: hypothetical protein R3E64_09665 [Halioglobus sp.]
MTNPFLSFCLMQSLFATMSKRLRYLLAELTHLFFELTIKNCNRLMSANATLQNKVSDSNSVFFIELLITPPAAGALTRPANGGANCLALLCADFISIFIKLAIALLARPAPPHNLTSIFWFPDYGRFLTTPWTMHHLGIDTHFSVSWPKPKHEAEDYS